MTEITITKKGYSILRKIVTANKEYRPLVVTFDSDRTPITDFDLHAADCDVLVDEGLVEYLDVIFTTDLQRIWEDTVLPVQDNISAKVVSTNLGEFALEQYDKNEKRFRNSEVRSWIAIGISLIAVLISIIAYGLIN